MIKRIILFIFLAGFSWPRDKIACVDMTLLVETFVTGLGYDKEMAKKKERSLKDIMRIYRRVQYLEKKLADRIDQGITDNGNLIFEINNFKEELYELVKKKNENLAYEERENSSEILEILFNAIKKYARKEDYLMVIDKNDKYTLYWNEDSKVDITADILEELEDIKEDMEAN
ncbi:MAG TPA: OmpH family outer membrane protein [Spirochaetota bacterium]|nr:OmpH family outer membrane protein [Spirochaetota bacterium]